MKRETEKFWLALGCVTIIFASIRAIGGGDTDTQFLAAMLFFATSAIINEVRNRHD